LYILLKGDCPIIGLSKTFKRRAGYAFLYWFASTLLATMIYSQMRWAYFIRVGKTAALWSLNSTLLAIVIFWITLKVPLGRFSKPVFFSVHLLAAIVVAGLSVGMVFLDFFIFADPVIVEYLHTMYPQFIQIWIIGYIAAAGWFYFLQYQKHSKEQVVREANLQKLSREAELKALKAQVNPHFLFNTLNSINALVIKDPKKTREMITRLGNMLRYVLDVSESDFVPLRQEMEFVEDYLAVEKTRLGEKLQLYVNVDKNLMDVPVPPIILQPLVENAVKHGVAKQTRGGRVKIDVSTEKGNLKYQVTNSGGILNTTDKNLNVTVNQGLGLRNIQERLKCIFNDDFSFNIKNNTPSGVIAAVVFPISPGKVEK
jgi:two-component system LytT family sensor kinase